MSFNKRTLLSLAATLSSVVPVFAGDNCNGKARNEGGNWFCSPVNRISYSHVGVQGEYQRVNFMALENGGTCRSEPKRFGGALAPFDEQMSIHLRGPLEIKRFAVYQGPNWSRTGYFNSGTGESRGLTFENNRGGQGSGVWDTTFGNSLSYASSDGETGSSRPVTWSGRLAGGLTELAIFSDRDCANGACGYVRPASEVVSRQGWAGSKVFAFEFRMPHENDRTGWNRDMPAIWSLNAQIPRMGQYVKEQCSCWKSGCGEVDFFEVLKQGDEKMKATIHRGPYPSGGTSDYFIRPTSSWQIGLAIFNDDQIIIQTMSDFGFGENLDKNVVREWMDDGKFRNGLQSTFKVT